MILKNHLASLFAALALSAAGPAICAPPATAPAARADIVTAQEAADADRVQKIVASMQNEGPAELSASLAELRQIADRAPASYPLTESRGALTIVRDDAAGPSTTLGLLLQAAADKRDMTVVRAYNTYGMARFLLGSYAVETRRYADAVRELDLGLSMQPDNPYMVAEKATALEGLARPSDALALLTPWLEAHELLPETEKALLLRNKGYALVELNRLDEAEAAYKQALILQPGHKGAETELRYIAQRRAGRPPNAPLEIMSGDKAAKVGPTTGNVP